MVTIGSQSLGRNIILINCIQLSIPHREEHPQTCIIATKVFPSHYTGRRRIHRFHMFLGLQDPDPLVRGMDPDPSIIIEHQTWNTKPRHKEIFLLPESCGQLEQCTA
jgi:hypothetical protein